MEEADLLGRLAVRLAGLVSVTASLRRARQRELEYRKQAQTADEKAEKLSQRLDEEHRSDRTEAVARAEILKAAAHSPAARIKLEEIEQHCLASSIELTTPLGVDPIPWAAYAHLRRNDANRPLIVLDCAERIVRTGAPWPLNSETSPWKRAAEGTLVLISPGALPEQSQLRLGEALETERPNFVVSCTTGSGTLLPRLKRQLHGPIVALPTLAERAEDIQALVISELAQLGLTHRGSPFGIEKAALYRIIQRPYPGNDAELKGLLAAIAGYATAERITLEDLRQALGQDESEAPPLVTPTRARSRRPPRAKRP
jgi:transcriptional regulator of acetoin/glycerol metabolism